MRSSEPPMVEHAEPGGLQVSKDLARIAVTFPRWLDHHRLITVLCLTVLIPALLSAPQLLRVGSDTGLAFTGFIGAIFVYYLGVVRPLKSFARLGRIRLSGMLQEASLWERRRGVLSLFWALLVPFAGFVHLCLMGSALGLTWDMVPSGAPEVVLASVLFSGLLVLLSCLGCLRRPTLSVTGSHVHVKEWRTRSWALEGLLVEVRRNRMLFNGQVLAGTGRLTEAERHWLAAHVREAVQLRQERLRTAGHDLDEPVVVPEALRQMREP